MGGPVAVWVAVWLCGLRRWVVGVWFIGWWVQPVVVGWMGGRVRNDLGMAAGMAGSGDAGLTC